MAHPDGDRFGALLSAAIGGDQQAYATLLVDVTPVLRGLVSPKFATGDVEDIVQDILMSLHAARHTYEPDRPFFPWLFTIARRRMSDHLRREYRQRRLSGADYTLLRGGDACQSQVEDEMTVATVLEKWLPGLTKSQSVAVRLLKVRGLTLAEAATESGMTPAALKVAAHRAMKTLRTDLAEGMA